MADPSDMELLRDYHRQGSEEAFAGLVQRHINLVYSAAIRHVGIAAHAEEITQVVFVILARKAASLRSDIILESWLHETTRLTALSFLRGERRRQFREQEAYMQSTLHPSADATAWNQLAPLLDEAVSRLGKKDRDALMLRFFKDKSLREVATALNTNEAAAQRRVLRAVEKLRGWFTRRGIALSATALTTAISANSVQAAPVGLAVTISATTVKGAAVAASVTALVNGTIKTIFVTTIQKTIIGVALAAAFVSTILLIRNSDPPSSPIAITALQTNEPVVSGIRSDSAFWRRFDSSRGARKAALSADTKLMDSLARLKAALYAPGDSDGRQNDLARKILFEIPLTQRAVALDLVMQALRGPEQAVCRRAISLIPLIWPEGEAALPALFDLVRNKSGDWPGLASEAMMAAVQVRSETDVIPELVLAAMQGGSRSQHELALQFPLLTGQIKESNTAFAANLQPFLNSTDPDVRLTAAQALAQLPGAKNNLVVAELAASLALNDGTRATTDKIRGSLDALLKMGVDARDAVPALLALVNANPELSNSALIVLKTVAPDALKGVGIPTPLPPLEGTSQAISRDLAAGTWTIQNAIDALKSPDLLLPTARALADFGPDAAEALPALRQALEAIALTNLNAAVMLGAAIERLDPKQPKPLLLMWDIMPALDGVRAEAQQANISRWDEALASLHEHIPLGVALSHNDVRRLATELGRIDPRLQRVFQAKLLEVDVKFAALFPTADNH